MNAFPAFFQKTLLEKKYFHFWDFLQNSPKWSLFRHLVTVFEVALLIFRIADQITIPNDENENVNETFHLFRPKVRWKLLIFFFPPLSLFSWSSKKEKSCKRSSNILFFLCVNQLIVQFIISPRAFKNHLRTHSTVKCKLWESLNLMLVVELLPCVSFKISRWLL